MSVPRRIAALQKIAHGCHVSPNPFALDQYQADIVQNFHIDGSGVARSRRGSRLLNTTALDGKVTSIYEYRRPDGGSMDRIILVTAGKALYKWDATAESFTYVQELTTEDRPTWATFYAGDGVSYAFMANGTDFYKYNGDTVSNVADSYPWSSNPRYIMEYDSRLLAAGCDSDPYVVWVSDALDGTTWEWSDPEAAQYWTVKSAQGDRVMGLGRMYDYAVIYQNYATNIITGADPTDTGTAQITVSDKYGTSSHWSIQTVGATVYFADQLHIYRGVLRDAIENGLNVEKVDKYVYEKYKLSQNPTDITSAYDARNNEIQWSIKTRAYGKNDMTLVYNVELSHDSTYYGRYDVWSGWFSGDGYEPYTLGTVTDDEDTKPRIWRGDESGYVYVMEEQAQYKDSTAAADENIPYRIRTAPVMPHGIGALKRGRELYLYLSQLHDASTYVQWLIDGGRVGPTTTQYEDYYGWVPLIRAATGSDQTQTIGTVAIAEEPVVPCAVTMNEPFHWCQFSIRNDGSSTRDSVTYAGGELNYQAYHQRRGNG